MQSSTGIGSNPTEVLPKAKGGRDPLTNLTNKNAPTDLPPLKPTAAEKTKKFQEETSTTTVPTSTSTTTSCEPKVSKRTSDPIDGPRNKRRKSDPMMIDHDQLLKEANQFNRGSRPSSSSSSPAPTAPPLQEWENIDQHDIEDPQSLAEYVNPIYDYLMQKEKNQLDCNYLSTQTEINNKMRAILIDWLIEVHRMFKLLPETLFLSTRIIDQYLSQSNINRNQLQLAGITAMFIASKYEEIYAPHCDDFVYISDSTYTRQQIIDMERTILTTIDYDLSFPSALHFLRRYSKAANSDYNIHTLCKYIIEHVLVDVKFLQYPASLLAAASVYLSRLMMGRVPYWNTTLKHYSTYDEPTVRECAAAINQFLKKSQTSSLKAVRKKYSSPKFGNVASIPLADL